MKKTVRVKEFIDFCRENKPKAIIYQTENQEWYRMSDPCRQMMSFPVIMVHENPNVIYLESGTNKLSLGRVKYVEIDTEATALGTLFRVCCGDRRSDAHDISYTLIAQ